MTHPHHDEDGQEDEESREEDRQDWESSGEVRDEGAHRQATSNQPRDH